MKSCGVGSAAASCMLTPNRIWKMLYSGPADSTCPTRYVLSDAVYLPGWCPGAVPVSSPLPRGSAPSPSSHGAFEATLPLI